MSSNSVDHIQEAPSASRNGLAYWPGLFLFFLILFVPTTYQALKGSLLVLVVGSIVLSSIKKREFHLAPLVILLSALMVGTGLIFILYGVVNGNPGALQVTTVYVIWPVVFTVLISGITSSTVLDDISRVLIAGTVAISLYSMSYILTTIGFLPDYLYFELDQGQGIGIYTGYVEYSLYSVSSLNFLVPFTLSAFFIWSDRRISPVSRKWVLLALTLSTILVFVSGRRALWLIVLAAPVISIAFQALFPSRTDSSIGRSKFTTLFGSAAIFIALYAYLQHVAALDISALVETLIRGFDFIDDESAYARSSQAIALLEGWGDNYLFGAGHGAAAGVTRSDTQPWAYELSYLALLYHTGLVGSLIYLSGIAWIYFMSVRIIRTGHRFSLYLIPTIVGTSCFLIANATNPYLEKFDYIWVIFLPISIINLWLIECRTAKLANEENQPGRLNSRSC